MFHVCIFIPSPKIFHCGVLCWFSLMTNVCTLILLFSSQRYVWTSCFSRKHTEDVLVFFSPLVINGRKLNVGWRNERGTTCFNQHAKFVFIDKQELNYQICWCRFTVGRLTQTPPGGGVTPIWNWRGCSSEILNLTHKGDHLGVAQAFCDP